MRPGMCQLAIFLAQVLRLTKKMMRWGPDLNCRGVAPIYVMIRRAARLLTFAQHCDREARRLGRSPCGRLSSP